MKPLNTRLRVSSPSHFSVRGSHDYDQVWMDELTTIKPTIKPTTATEIEARWVEAEREYQKIRAQIDKQINDAVMHGAQKVQRWNAWTAVMGELPPNHPAIDRLRSIRDWENDGKINVANEVDLCIGVSRCIVRVTGVPGAVFIERQDQFPSEQLFARIAIAVEVAK